MSSFKTLKNVGQQILSFIKSNYNQGGIFLGIDPYIWNECVKDADAEQNILSALRDTGCHEEIVRGSSEDHYFAFLALISFQVSIYYDYSENDAFNKALSDRIGVERRNINAYYQLVQDTLWSKAKDYLSAQGFNIDIPETSHGPWRYVNYPKSHSLKSQVSNFDYKYLISVFSKIWSTSFGWSPDLAIQIDFKENVFWPKMKRNVEFAKMFGSLQENKKNLVLGYLYGYFSKVWDGNYFEPNPNPRNQVQNNSSEKYEISISSFCINSSSAQCSFDVRKSGKKISSVLDEFFEETEGGRPFAFIFNEMYSGYAVRASCGVNTTKDLGKKALVILTRAPSNPPDGVVLYDWPTFLGKKYKVAYIPELTEEIIRSLNIKTESPMFEYVGGLGWSCGRLHTRWLDFAIPKFKINILNCNQISIDGIPINLINQEISLHSYSQNTLHVITIPGVSRKIYFEILNESQWNDQFANMDIYKGWLIDKGSVECSCSESFFIDGLNGTFENKNNETKSILYQDLNRLTIIKSNAENKKIENRKKYVY